MRGASKGEGLGNQFLANIREVDAICHVVRCFEDANVVHVEGRIDPAGDVATIDTELCLKDLESVDKRIERAKKALKGPAPKEEKLTLELCERIRQAPRRRASRCAPRGCREAEQALVRDLFLLTSKKVFFVANVAEGQLAKADSDPLVAALRAHAAPAGRAGGGHLRGGRGGDRLAWTRPIGPPSWRAWASRSRACTRWRAPPTRSWT